MNILHYLNVIIGFSLVMLLLSIITGFATQSWLILFRAKGRAIGNGLAGILENIGLENKSAKLTVDALLDKGNSIFGEKFGRFLNKISAYFLAGAPKNIGREEFLLLLLRKAGTDNELATKLGFQNAAEALGKLGDLEVKMLEEETKDPALPAQVWRTKAMQAIVPKLASKIFARFDEVIDRVMDDISVFGKFLGIIITFPLLLIYWPVDSIDLLNRLNNDQLLSGKLAEIAETNLPLIQKAHDDLQKCQESNKDNPELKQACEQSHQALKNVATDTIKLSTVEGLFGNEAKKELECKIPILGLPIPYYPDCKRAELTPGIFVTWILVSLGSAFWLGVLNKMLGVRSEFTKKLAAEREYRATNQG